MAQHTKTVGWVPGDEGATMKREVCDYVGNMAGGTQGGREGYKAVKRTEMVRR